MVCSPNIKWTLTFSKCFTRRLQADFGLTCEGNTQPFQTTHYARGKPRYRAPELCQGGDVRYNNKVDTWSLGCIAYELLLGFPVFNSDFEVFQFSNHGGDLKLLQGCISTGTRLFFFDILIAPLLKVQTTDRPSTTKFKDTLLMYREVFLFLFHESYSPSEDVGEFDDGSSISSSDSFERRHNAREAMLRGEWEDSLRSASYLDYWS